MVCHFYGNNMLRLMSCPISSSRQSHGFHHFFPNFVESPPVTTPSIPGINLSPVPLWSQANHLHSLNPIHPHIQLSGIPAMHLPFPLLPVRHLSILLCFHSPENPDTMLHHLVTSYRQMIHILSHFPLTAFLRMSLLRLSHLNT